MMSAGSAQEKNLKNTTEPRQRTAGVGCGILVTVLLGVLTARPAAAQNTFVDMDDITAARCRNDAKDAPPFTDADHSRGSVDVTGFQQLDVDDGRADVTTESITDARRLVPGGTIGSGQSVFAVYKRGILEDVAARYPTGGRSRARTFESSVLPHKLTSVETTPQDSLDRLSAGRGDRSAHLFEREMTSRPSVPSSDSLPTDVDVTTKNTWQQLFRVVIRDQKDVVTFPRQVARGHHRIAAVALTAATAGLVVLDPRDTPPFGRTPTFQRFNTVASGFNTGVGMALVPAAFYLSRIGRDDTYGKQTVFAAAEAIADVQILTIAMKMIDRRIRPVDVPQAGGHYADTWFKAHVLGGKSFPSGHTITAFALAEVFVERYREHRWIPWVAYGLAAGVGFSRLTLQAHFPSDVFAGAALGIVITHGLVLHRPAVGLP